MNNNIKKTKKTIKEEYNDNIVKIKELEEKIDIISSNSLGTKADMILIFGMLPLMGFTLLVALLGVPKFIPLNLIRPLYVGIPLLIGIVGEKLTSRRFKFRERLRIFSDAKTQREINEELVRYEIEKKKVINANRVLENVYADLEEKENFINYLSESYNITEKKTDNISVEDIDNNKNTLDKKRECLDRATIKCFLKDKFWKIRTKGNKYDRVYINVFAGILVSMFLYNFPVILLSGQLYASLLSILIPSVIGGMVFGGYEFSKVKSDLSIFRKINNELGSEAIPNIRKDNELQYDRDLDNIIEESYVTRLQLESEKRKLEEINKDVATSNNKNRVALREEIMDDREDEKGRVRSLKK